MKTLIITVGTRQVGWRCRDGIVRSLGADGGASPPHINELYTLELEQEREYHPDHQSWSVRHLSEQFYSLCELKQTYSPVEFLIDDHLIAQEVKNGLTQVVLWGTDQPEDISWNFRRFDTLWLANLMAGKLRQLYPLLQVEVWNPVLAANNPILLCQSVEAYILNEVFDAVPEAERKDFTLLIENKGSVPLIANALEMCAVALSRQCHVKLIVPTEPDPLFIVLDNGYQAVQCSTHCTYLPIGKYFWPLEKPKIISAWQRGDFGEAQLWLSTHRDRYKVLYELAEFLQLASNWEIEKAITQIKSQWFVRRDVKRRLSVEQRENWQALAESLRLDNKTTAIRFLWAWERVFLYEIAVQQHKYSEAFLRFALVLETILSIQYTAEDWLAKEYLSPPEGKSPEEYKPTLGGFIIGWRNKYGYDKHHILSKLLNDICELRNQAIHYGTPITAEKIISILHPIETHQNLSLMSEADIICLLMQQVLKKMAHPVSKPPQDVLLKSLYTWGLDLLEAEQ
jgi:hypothetical protein